MSAALIKTAELLVQMGWALSSAAKADAGAETEPACRAATTDIAGLASNLQATASPELRLATGLRSGIFALKVDGWEGATSLSRLDREARGLPSSLGFMTANGEVSLFRLPPGWVVESSNLDHGLEVLAENGSVAIPPLIGPDATAWAFPPTYCEIEWPPTWLLERLTAFREEIRQDDWGQMLAAALFEAHIARGARREDALVDAARRFAPLHALGLVQLVEAQTQLLSAAEANGLSYSQRWFSLEPQLLSIVKTAPKPEGVA